MFPCLQNLIKCHRVLHVLSFPFIPSAAQSKCFTLYCHSVLMTAHKLSEISYLQHMHWLSWIFRIIATKENGQHFMCLFSSLSTTQSTLQLHDAFMAQSFGAIWGSVTLLQQVRRRRWSSNQQRPALPPELQLPYLRWQNSMPTKHSQVLPVWHFH